MSNNHPLPMKSGDERDAFTRFKRFLNFRAGERKLVKARYSRRVRRELKADILSCAEFWGVKPYAADY